MKFGYRQHCGGLRESLFTREYIDDITFARLIVDYEFYAYDPRCSQILFIAKDMKSKYLWLFIELDDYDIYETYRHIREKHQ